MTRKDYVLIARAIRGAMTAGPFTEAAVVSRLAYELKQDNPHFDEAKFIEACGLEARR